MSHRNYPESRMTFCDFLLKQKPSDQRTSECVSCWNATLGLCVWVCVCVIRSESFDVNKLCHCFVRPLSPKQHIISLLLGLSFLSVCFCVYLHYWCMRVCAYLCLFVQMWQCMQYVCTVWVWLTPQLFVFGPMFSWAQCDRQFMLGWMPMEELVSALCMCVCFSSSLSFSSSVSIIHSLSQSLIHLNLSLSLTLSFTH